MNCLFLEFSTLTFLGHTWPCKNKAKENKPSVQGHYHNEIGIILVVLHSQAILLWNSIPVQSRKPCCLQVITLLPES